MDADTFDHADAMGLGREVAEKEEALEEEADFWAKELESRSEEISKQRSKVQVPCTCTCVRAREGMCLNLFLA